MPLLREYMLAQPTHHVFGVFGSCLAKTKQLPNLGAMIFDRAAQPVILGPVRWGDLRLHDKVMTAADEISLSLFGNRPSA